MSKGKKRSGARPGRPQPLRGTKGKRKGARLRSEERFSRNAETDLVCRLLLEKKKIIGVIHKSADVHSEADLLVFARRLRDVGVEPCLVYRLFHANCLPTGQ